MQPQVIPSTNEFQVTSDPFSDIWLTADDIVALGRSRRKVLLNISSGKWISRPSERRLANRKRMREVALESLPEDLQRRWLQSRQKAEGAARELQIPDSKFQTPDSGEDLDTLKGEHRLVTALQRFSPEEREAFLDEARRRMKIVELYIALPVKREKILNSGGCGFESRAVTSATEFLEEHPNPAENLRTTRSTSAVYQFTPAVLALCQEARCTNEVIINYYKARQHSVRKNTEPMIAREISAITLDNWSRRIKSEGLLLFLPPPPNRAERLKGDGLDKRLADIPTAAVEWINRNYRSKPHARALYQDLKKAAHKHGWKIPSESWVYRKWKQLPKIISDSLRNKKSYVDKFAPYYPRDHRDVEALQILCGDHSERDVLVRLPDGTLTRPWLTTWQCVRTGLIWGWYLDLTPSSRTIGLAYANGVRTFGAQPLARPDEGFYSYLYTDQGRDYKSHAITGKILTFKRAAAIEGGLAFLCDQRGTHALDASDERHVGLIKELGLKWIEARGYNAREKPVERFHRDISGWESKTFKAEYCGPDPKSRPDACRDAQARHERLIKKAQRTGNTPWLDESPFMTLEDYREALAGYFVEYNHDVHERTTLGGAKVVPIEEYKRLYTTHYEISEKTLALVLMKAEKRVVRKNGVSINGFEYLHTQLAYYKKLEVEVRYSDDDFRRVFIVPPPTDAIPHPDIIEADAVIRGGVRNPNRETQKQIARQRNFEEKVKRDHDYITQSMIRGESVQDRVAAQIEPEEEVEVRIAVSGGDGRGRVFEGTHASHGLASTSGGPARVHQLTRLDRKRIGRSAIRPVTVDQVAELEVDEDLFDAGENFDQEKATGKGKVRMWEPEDEDD
jgi:hypothetical protein